MITVNSVIYSYKKFEEDKKDNLMTATTDSFSLVSTLQDEELWSLKLRKQNLKSCK